MKIPFWTKWRQSKVAEENAMYEKKLQEIATYEKKAKTIEGCYEILSSNTSLTTHAVRVMLTIICSEVITLKKELKKA